MSTGEQTRHWYPDDSTRVGLCRSWVSVNRAKLVHNETFHLRIEIWHAILWSDVDHHTTLHIYGEKLVEERIGIIIVGGIIVGSICEGLATRIIVGLLLHGISRTAVLASKSSVMRLGTFRGLAHDCERRAARGIEICRGHVSMSYVQSDGETQMTRRR